MTGTAKATKARANKFAADCNDCGNHLPAGAGNLVKAADGWIVRCPDACTTRANKTPVARAAQLAADPGQSGFYTATEEAIIIAAGIDNPFDPRIEDVLAAAGLRAAAPAPAKPARHTTTSRRRKACVTDGNCSSHSGRTCGGHNCDAN